MAQRPPAARAALSPAQRYRTLGNTALALAILELLYCLYRLVAQLFSKNLFDAQRSFFPKNAEGMPMQGMLEAGRELAQKIAIWEALRTIPFLAATSFLLWIALRLREGDHRALFTARRWVLGAFGAIAVSLAIQFVWTVPPTLEYQRKVMASLPAFSAGDEAQPVAVGEMMSSVTAISTIFGVVFGAVVFSAWPIVLHVWAGRLIRETLPGGSREAA